jgi:DnaJ-class molecular chaperone
METNTVMMPRELTAENGAKALLIGEFSQRIPVFCPDCFGGGDGDSDGDTCGTCAGEGELFQDVNISWDNIKAIYAKAVQHLGI